MSPEEHLADRVAELGPFFGPIIAGIYDGIRQGVFRGASDFEDVAGRPHQIWTDYFAKLRT
jgi:NAD(P)H dehydrogenase (quinone)